MSWPGLLIRVLAVAWFVVAVEFNRTGLIALGIAPNLLARLTWNIALVAPVWAVAFPAAQRADRQTSAKWKIWG